MTDNEIAKLFIQLSEIPSPSGKEAQVAKFVVSYLKKIGFKVWQEKTGSKNNSNADNVYAYYQVDKKYDTFAFSAHMDTVQKDNDKIKVVFKNKIFKSSGNTILGADNKAGITALLTFAKELTSDKKNLKHNILLFFPTREESGVMGSSFFDTKKTTKIKYFFNADAGGSPGTFIYRSLGYKNFSLTINGVSAHAAKDYDSGRDAVLAASKIVTLLPIGKNTKIGYTMNVGSIHGGSATNVVCDQVEIKGEYRAFSDKVIKMIESKIVAASKTAEKLYGVEVKIDLDDSSYIPPFLGETKSSIVDFCKNVCKSLNIKPIFSESYSTSDACFYSYKGFQTISICRGGKAAHSHNESLDFDDLKKTISLLKTISLSA